MSTTDVREKKECRVCGGTALEMFLDLGAQPPANALLKKEELSQPEPFFPLALMHCKDCELIQTTHVVSPERLFRNYVYFSSVSGSMAKHFGAYAAHVADRFVPEKGLVVEIGSNDGILLKTLLGRPVRVLGVDPARNVAEVACKNGVPTLAEFFGRRIADQIKSEHGPASVVIANNVFAHIDDLTDVIEGVGALLAPGGVFVIEAPHVVPFLEHHEFDTIYHEHLSYLGVRPLDRLFSRFGMEVFEVQPQPVHGGTARVFVRRKSEAKSPVHESVGAFMEAETRAGTGDRTRLAAFARRVAAIREETRSFVADALAKNKRVVGYTAPAKGNVLTNYAKLGTESLRYIADATPAKQGLFSPGMHIPIVSPEEFRKDAPDYALMFAWNLREEILKREQEWHDKGGKFVTCIPKVEVF